MVVAEREPGTPEAGTAYEKTSLETRAGRGGVLFARGSTGLCLKVRVGKARSENGGAWQDGTSCHGPGESLQDLNVVCGRCSIGWHCSVTDYGNLDSAAFSSPPCPHYWALEGLCPQVWNITQCYNEC